MKDEPGEEDKPLWLLRYDLLLSASSSSTWFTMEILFNDCVYIENVQWVTKCQGLNG